MNVKGVVLLLLVIGSIPSLRAQSIELNNLYSRKVAAFNQGNLDEALTWGLKAVARAHEEFGDSETYANYASDLGQLYYQMKRYDEALSIFEKVASIYEQKLGVNHLYTSFT